MMTSDSTTVVTRADELATELQIIIETDNSTILENTMIA